MAAVVSLLAAVSRLHNGAQGSQQQSVLPDAQDCVQYHMGCGWTEQYACPGAAAPASCSVARVCTLNVFRPD